MEFLKMRCLFGPSIVTSKKTRRLILSHSTGQIPDIYASYITLICILCALDLWVCSGERDDDPEIQLEDWLNGNASISNISPSTTTWFTIHAIGHLFLKGSPPTEETFF